MRKTFNPFEVRSFSSFSVCPTSSEPGGTTISAMPVSCAFITRVK